MTKAAFNTANEIKALRNTLNGFFGEIVTVVVGKDALQKLYEDAAKNNELPEGADKKPVGVIALEKGWISLEARDALLVAQSAERVLRLAEQAENKGGNVVDPFSNDPKNIFKWVGSAKDAEIVKQVQGAWLAAQIYLNETLADNAPDDSYISAFKTFAAKFYIQASRMLEVEGYADIASKIEAIAGSIDQTGLANASSYSPANFIKQEIMKTADLTYKGALQGKLGIIPADLPRVLVAKVTPKNDRKLGQ